MKHALFLLSLLVSIAQSIEIDERITDIYFGNGVWNRIEGAKEGRLALSRHILYNIYDGNMEEFKRYHYSIRDSDEANENIILLSYNWTGILPGTGIGDFDEYFGYFWDVVETFDQLQKEGQLPSLTFWGWLQNSQHSKLREWLDNYFISIDGANIEHMLKRFHEISLMKSHRVLLVSHSQGNLFANRLFDALSPAEYREYFANLQVASPASSIHATKGEYVTFIGDKVINPIPYSMEGNAFLNPEDDVILDMNHEFVSEYLRQTDSFNKITEYFKSLLYGLVNAPSQWKMKHETGTCSEDGCGKRWTLEHRHNGVEDIAGVYPFQEGGKVYRVGGEYIKASAGGTEITALEDGSLCYRLEGTGEEISRVDQIPELSSGPITVDLIWEAPTLNLDLAVEGPTAGEVENQDGSCPMEHFFIAGEPEPGIYVVKVNLSASSGTEETPVGAKAIIRSGGKKETVVLAADSIGGLDVGPIAEIIVSEQGVQTQVIPSSSSSVTVSLAPAGRASDTTYSIYSSLVYEIIVLNEQLYYGPIKEAQLELYALDDYVAEASPLYSGTTSSGSEVHTAGRIPIPYTLIDGLDDDRLYILRAEGGVDIDTDDDGITDLSPTQNNGTMHAILTGKMLKDGGYKMNLLTELAYQATETMFANSSREEIVERLNAITPRMLAENIDRNGSLGFSDLIYWLPTLDKEKLSVDYSTTLEPIVQKIYNGEEIRDDVYRLLYYPEADAGENIYVDASLPIVLDGSGSADINGEIVEYHWREGNTTLCQGSEPICEIDNPGIGNYLISLEVVDDDGGLHSDETTVTVGAFAPHADAGENQTILTSGSYTLDASNSYDSNGEIVTYRWTEGETVWSEGSDPVCDVNLSQVRDYLFSLTVIDDKGQASTDSITITYPYKPVADAGADFEVAVGKSFVLDGSVSYDEDGYIVEYLWETEGSELCRSDDAECTTSISDAGEYTYDLTVTDDYGTTRKDSVTVTATVTNSYLLGQYDSPGIACYITLSSDKKSLYLADHESGVWIIDVSEPEHPTLIGRYDTQSYASEVALLDDETTMYVADTYAWELLDISNPSEPVLISSDGDFFSHVAVSADEETVSVTYWGSVTLFDHTDVGVLHRTASFSTSGLTYQPTFSASGETLYIPDSSGMKTVDISDKMNPILVSTYALNGATSIQLSLNGDIAYVGFNGGVDILDVSDGLNPVRLGTYETEAVKSMTLSEDCSRLFVADSFGELTLLDATTPAALTWLASYQIDNLSGPVRLADDNGTIFVPAGEDGLLVLKIALPE